MDGIAHHIIVHLSLIPSIGASIIQRILQQIVPTQLSTLYSFSVSEWQALGFSYKVATALHEGMCNAALLERELVLLQREGVQVITCLDEAYPPHLRHIHLPPPLLYYRGNIDLLTNKAKRLAVVGSRNATSYAQRALNALLPPLIKEGVIIVSGGARGVDAMAHSVTLNSNGATIAVVGSGFLHPYPRQHTKLF
jgi:DNA processing protein